jgi:hypothetical protein
VNVFLAATSQAEATSWPDAVVKIFLIIAIATVTIVFFRLFK